MLSKTDVFVSWRQGFTMPTVWSEENIMLHNFQYLQHTGAVVSCNLVNPLAITSAITFVIYHPPHHISVKKYRKTKTNTPKVLEMVKYNICLRPGEAMLFVW